MTNQAERVAKAMHDEAAKIAKTRPIVDCIYGGNKTWADEPAGRRETWLRLAVVALNIAAEGNP